MLWKAKKFAILKSLDIKLTICLSGRSIYEKIWEFHLHILSIELLTSDDNINYTLYLLNFFLARYKAYRNMWKFSQPSHKNILYKIMQKNQSISVYILLYK